MFLSEIFKEIMVCQHKYEVTAVVASECALGAQLSLGAIVNNIWRWTVREALITCPACSAGNAVDHDVNAFSGSRPNDGSSISAREPC